MNQSNQSFTGDSDFVPNFTARPVFPRPNNRDLAQNFRRHVAPKPVPPLKKSQQEFFSGPDRDDKVPQATD